MRSPMLRFVIVAVLLLVLVIFYATRLGEEPQTEPPEDPASPSGTGHNGDGPVAPVVDSDGPDEEWFPDLSDRNDIPGVNLGVTSGRTSFGCNVSDLTDRLGNNFAGDESGARLVEYINILTASGDAERSEERL